MQTESFTTDAVLYTTGGVLVNTPSMPPLITGDTIGRRLAFARWLTAGQRGVAEVSQNEMSGLVREAGGEAKGENSYGRWEREDSAPSDQSLTAVGEVAGVNWLWLRYGSNAPVDVPVPEGYEEWVAKAVAREAEEAKRLPFKREKGKAIGKKPKRHGGEGRSA